MRCSTTRGTPPIIRLRSRGPMPVPRARRNGDAFSGDAPRSRTAVPHCASPGPDRPPTTAAPPTPSRAQSPAPGSPRPSPRGSAAGPVRAGPAAAPSASRHILRAAAPSATGPRPAATATDAPSTPRSEADRIARSCPCTSKPPFWRFECTDSSPWSKRAAGARRRKYSANGRARHATGAFTAPAIRQNPAGIRESAGKCPGGGDPAARLRAVAAGAPRALHATFQPVQSARNE